MNIPWEAIEGLFCYIAASTAGFIWWMATMTADMRAMKDLVRSLTDLNGLYAKKEDMARELGILERRQETMWKKYDELKEKVDINIRK